MLEMFDNDGQLSREWMSAVLDPPTFGGMSIHEVSDLPPEVCDNISSDDFRDEDMQLEDLLQDNTIKILQKRLTEDRLISLLKRTAPEEVRHCLAVERLKLCGDHPPESSSITGPVRAFLFDDDTHDLEPLSYLERRVIDELFTSVELRLTRSRAGFERKMVRTGIARTDGDS